MRKPRPWKVLWLGQAHMVRVGGRSKVQEGGDVHIPMSDSSWYMAETNTINNFFKNEHKNRKKKIIMYWHTHTQKKEINWDSNPIPGIILITRRVPEMVAGLTFNPFVCFVYTTLNICLISLTIFITHKIIWLSSIWLEKCGVLFQIAGGVEMAAFSNQAFSF